MEGERERMRKREGINKYTHTLISTNIPEEDKVVVPLCDEALSDEEALNSFGSGPEMFNRTRRGEVICV